MEKWKIIILGIVLNNSYFCNLKIENCWLGGDESVKTDDEKFFGVSAKLAELVTVKEAELKKL